MPELTEIARVELTRVKAATSELIDEVRRLADRIEREGNQLRADSLRNGADRLEVTLLELPDDLPIENR